MCFFELTSCLETVSVKMKLLSSSCLRDRHLGSFVQGIQGMDCWFEDCFVEHNL
jgi:hypothetical protein